MTALQIFPETASGAGGTGSRMIGPVSAMAAIYTDEGSAQDTVELVRDAISALSPSPTDWLDVLTYTERDGGEYEPIWRCKMVLE